MAKLSAEDRAEITNLIHFFFIHLDNGNEEGFGELFTDESELKMPLRKCEAKGKDALKKWCGFVHSKFPHALHWEGNVAITPYASDSNRAENISYWQAVDEGKVVSTGKHIDTFVKESNSGKWYFEKRLVLFTWTAAGGNEDVKSQLQ